MTTPIQRPTFYITTPIFYVNDVPHLGHAYCAIAADVIARFKRISGYDVRFTTGTDEHGEKIAEAARSRGVEPKAYCDLIVKQFIDAWALLEVQYDDFIRTTEARHEKAVEAFSRRLLESGDIYKGTYRGWYCVQEETFWPEARLIKGHPCGTCGRRMDAGPDGTLACGLGHVNATIAPLVPLCPDCTRPVKQLEEENYFFRLSYYTDFLRKHFEENPDFVMPSHRKAEMTAILREGLQDVSITRTTFTWGLPFPDAPGHVIYVWFEALMNYVTSVGFAESSQPDWRYWPADVQLLGKDIARFHTLMWPAMLKAAGLEVPRRFFLHGMITNSGVKMSKSLGNVVDPFALTRKYGADAVRFCLMREVVLGNDGDFNEDALVTRYNADLANGLGNLLSRSVSMIEKYRGGRVPVPSGTAIGVDADVIEVATATPAAYARAMEAMAYSTALDEAWRLVRRLDKYVDESKPWELAKKNDPRLDRVLCSLAEGLRLVSLMAEPFMPSCAALVRVQLGLEGPARWEDAVFHPEGPGSQVTKGAAVFPRIDREAARPQ